MVGVKESVEHILPVGNKQTNAQELNYELNPEQEYFETDELFDDEYELIKSEHLSQVLCNDPLETLRKRGYSESDLTQEKWRESWECSYKENDESKSSGMQ